MADPCVSDTALVPINEYGSNLYSSKYDPLAAIEAKFALKSGKLPEHSLSKLKMNVR